MNTPPLELESATCHGSGNMTGTYYKVEVRSTSSMPTVIDNNFVIDNYWRQIPVRLGAVKWGTNIPVCSWDAEAAKHGLVSYLAAEAHRWAFLAFLEATVSALCTETRLVAVKFHQSYTTEELGVTAPVERRHKAPNVEPRSLSSGE